MASKNTVVVERAKAVLSVAKKYGQVLDSQVETLRIQRNLITDPKKRMMLAEELDEERVYYHNLVIKGLLELKKFTNDPDPFGIGIKVSDTLLMSKDQLGNDEFAMRETIGDWAAKVAYNPVAYKEAIEMFGV